MRFVLASSSPRRQEIISTLGIPFETLKPEVDESIREGEDPITYVKRICVDKAAAVAARLHDQMNHDEALILAADTIVLAADTIGVQESDDFDADPQYILLSKPTDKADARSMLVRLRENPHTVYTAFRLLKIFAHGDHAARMEYVDDIVNTEVMMRDYSDEEIDAYIASGDPFDKAGAYAIQNEQFRPVSEIEGCYYNVVGLPLCAVKRAMTKFGWWGFGVSDTCDCPPYLPPVDLA